MARPGSAELQPAAVSYSCRIGLMVGELVPAFRAFIRAAKIILSTEQIYSLESGPSMQIDGRETLTNHTGEGGREYLLSPLVFYVSEAHLEVSHSLTHSFIQTQNSICVSMCVVTKYDVAVLTLHSGAGPYNLPCKLQLCKATIQINGEIRIVP